MVIKITNSNSVDPAPNPWSSCRYGRGVQPSKADMAQPRDGYWLISELMVKECEEDLIGRSLPVSPRWGAFAVYSLEAENN